MAFGRWLLDQNDRRLRGIPVLDPVASSIQDHDMQGRRVSY